MLDVSALTSTLPVDAFDRPGRSENPARSMDLLFAQSLLKELRRSLPKDGLLGGKELETFLEMFDAVLAEDLADSGKLGIGASLTGARPPAPVSHHPYLRSAPRPGATLPVRGRLSSPHGERVDPLHGHVRQHAGIDVAAPRGTPILSVAGGTVRFAGEQSGYGNLVIVDHPDGTETRYAHCDQILVREGQAIPRGEPVARVGETGRATGPHLHFEVRRDGKAVDPLTHFGWTASAFSGSEPVISPTGHEGPPAPAGTMIDAIAFGR